MWVLPEEKEAIQANAKTVSLSVSEFLRNLGTGTRIRPVVDPVIGRQILALAGQVGRIGGLLKMLLTNEERFKGVRGVALQIQTKALLDDMESTKTELRNLVKIAR